MKITKKNTLITLCGLFVALNVVGAYLQIPLPSPFVSISLQTLFVILSGLLLGPKFAVITQVVYVAIGLVGLPVFTKGGGIGYVFQPSFGYLIGFIVGAFVAGYLSRNAEKLSTYIFAGLIGLAVIYAIGTPYLFIIVNYYFSSNMTVLGALYAGVVPYISFDVLSILLAAYLAKRLKKAL